MQPFHSETQATSISSADANAFGSNREDCRAGADQLQQTLLCRLILAISTGDHQAMHQLHKLTSKLIYHVTFAVLQHHQDAEEAAWDSYLQIWHSAERYDPEKATVTAWVAMIARSRAIDYCRKRTRSGQFEIRQHDPLSETLPLGRCVNTSKHCQAGVIQPETRLAELSNLLEQFFPALPLLQRQVLLLNLYHDYTHQEIASGLKLPLGTVKSLIRRGLKQLRERVN